jgi:hypothetical protein
VRNRRLFTVEAGSDLYRSQALSLEGDFDRYFTTYSPDGYGADALYFLTPDVMVDLVETAIGWDVEFVDASMVFFRPGRTRVSELGALVAFGAQWSTRAARWARWRDQRSDPDARVGQRVPVHAGGHRLEGGRVVAIGIFIGLGLVVLAMPVVGALTS